MRRIWGCLAEYPKHWGCFRVIARTLADQKATFKRNMDRRPPPPPPASPAASASTASAVSAAAAASRSVAAPLETTIGRYIARFRNDEPRPREARAAVASGDFWWAQSPRFKRMQAQSPASAASFSPRRSFDFEEDDEEEQKTNRGADSRGSERSTARRSPADARPDLNPQTKRSGNDMYASLDELELQVRRDIGGALSAAPSVAHSWSSSDNSIRDGGAESAASSHSQSSAAEDPEAVIERVRQRLGWQTSSSTSHRTSSFETEEIPVISPASTSNFSQMSNNFRGLRLDLDSPIVSLSQQNSVELRSSAFASPDLDIPPLLSSSSSMQPRLSPEQLVHELQTTVQEESPRKVTPCASFDSLHLELDPSIRALSTSPRAIINHSTPTGSNEPDDFFSAHSRFTSTVDNLQPDLDRSPQSAAPTSSEQSREDAQFGFDQESIYSPDKQEISDQESPANKPITPTHESRDEVQIPREQTPPRATPPLPPAHMSILANASNVTSHASCSLQKSPAQQDESPRTAAEHVLNTLVGFVVHSWGEEDASIENTDEKKLAKVERRRSQASSPSSVLAKASLSVNPESVMLEGNLPPNDSDLGKSDLPYNQGAVKGLCNGEIETVEGGTESDDDNVMEGETDEMSLLLVERIAVFKEALRRLQEQEAVKT